MRVDNEGETRSLFNDSSGFRRFIIWAAITVAMVDPRVAFIEDDVEGDNIE